MYRDHITSKQNKKKKKKRRIAFHTMVPQSATNLSKVGGIWKSTYQESTKSVE